MKKVCGILIAVFSIYGENWNVMNPVPDGRAQCLTIGYHAGDQYIYAADEYSWPYRSINEGAWDSLGYTNQPPVSSPFTIITSSTQANHVYIVRFSGDRIYYSHNYGETWESRWDPSLNPFVWRLAMVPNNPGYVYAGCKYSVEHENTFYYTTDFGFTWNIVSGVPNQTIYDISIYDEDKIYAIIGDNLYKYDGTSWTCVFTGCMFGKVKVDPNNPQRVFVSVPTVLWRSLDGGNNWEPVFHSTDYISSIEVGVSGWVYVGVYGKGIFRSQTGNPNSFEDITKNMYDKSILTIKVDPIHPDRIYVGTNFNVYRSPHATLSKDIFAWYEFNEGMRKNRSQIQKLKTINKLAYDKLK